MTESILSKLQYVPLATCKYVYMQAGKDHVVLLHALKEPGGRDVTPPVSAPMGQNAIQPMGHVLAQLVGMGHAVIKYAR